MSDKVPNAEDLLKAIPPQRTLELRRLLEAFLVDHNDSLRPICLVSSGGTAADLEVNAVRTLENFSTGLRGAVAVEELLERGYAVLHLWRTGSAAPFARVVHQHVSAQRRAPKRPAANHPLDVESLDRLFAGGDEEDDPDDMVQTVLQEEEDRASGRNTETPEVRLHRSLQNSMAVQRTLQQRREASGRLLTIPFRSVDEYLAKLQLCAEAMNESGALAMFFLAAAVSDFYVPLTHRTQHKIQSGDGGGLTLQLHPVPKVLGQLRYTWAPRSFVVSFKLETDATILRQKSERAVERYGCHMVIGNLLQSRHDRVSILAPNDFSDGNPCSAAAWPTHVVTREQGAGDDALESALVDFVTQSHLEFVSHHLVGANDDVDALQQRRERIMVRKAKLRRQAFWAKLRGTAIDVSGVGLALVLSYTINSLLQRRFRALS